MTGRATASVKVLPVIRCSECGATQLSSSTERIEIPLCSPSDLAEAINEAMLNTFINLQSAGRVMDEPITVAKGANHDFLRRILRSAAFRRMEVRWGCSFARTSRWSQDWLGRQARIYADREPDRSALLSGQRN